MATVIERASNITRVVTFPRPDFNLSKLEPGTHYSIQLFAKNKIGKGNQSFPCFSNFISMLCGLWLYATNILCARSAFLIKIPDIMVRE